jgi:uncharacterized membrane protein YhaH (DUF805 family)
MTHPLSSVAHSGQVSFTVNIYGALLIALISLAVAVAAAVVGVRRMRETETSRLRDRLRVMSAVSRYDFWLEMRGVRRRRRRDLREELRANLADATPRVGAKQAVEALGSLRQMSADAVGNPGPGPRWANGSIGAGVVFTVCAVVELISLISWLSAARASGVSQVHGALPLFPASKATFDLSDGGLSAGLEPGWLIVVATVLAFVVASRPWLALRPRETGG